MAVERIEQFRQLDGQDILKVYLEPQVYCPNGAYFYASAEDIDVVNICGWNRIKKGGNPPLINVYSSKKNFVEFLLNVILVENVKVFL